MREHRQLENDASSLTKPLKLALVSHQIGRHDGQGRVSYEIAIAALKRGYELTLLAERCEEELASNSRVQLVSFKTAGIPTQLIRNLSFAAKTTKWLKNHKHDLDIIQVNGFITWAASDVNVAHFVHGAWLKNPYYPFSKWWRNGYIAYQYLFTRFNAHWERKAFNHCQSIVAVSEKVGRELESIRVPSSKVTVIHNGVDVREFHPGPAERSSFSLPSNIPLFLFAGDIRTSRKNLETVLKAIQATPDIHLAIAGDIHGSPYPSLVEQLQLRQRVHFLGMVRNMPLLMRSVDGFVFPSRYDPLGLVILEAMASGLPVIASRTAGGSEILGEAGLILENPNDADTLSSWLMELSVNTSLRYKLGEMAREVALSHTWSHMANRYLALYEMLYREKRKANIGLREATTL